MTIVRIKFIIFILLSLSVFTAGYAAEIDSVTPRKVELANSLSRINEIINERLLEGVQKANEQPVYIEEEEFFDDTEEVKYCDEEALYTELRKAIYQSFTASWGLKGYDLDLQFRELLKEQSYSLSLNDSIYRDIDYIEGFSLNLKELSDVINIDGHLIGVDKLGHFFSEGWQYFEYTHFDGESIDYALDWGRQQEAGKFGYSTTGIFSFADLVANFNGWRFWNKVLLKQDDPLKNWLMNLINRPFVSCDIQIMASIKSRKLVKAWELNTEFDLSDYIDGTWDEGNNCNSYDDPTIEKKVMSRIKDVDPDFRCPYEADYCIESRAKYGEFAKHLLHPYCLIVSDD